MALVIGHLAAWAAVADQGGSTSRGSKTGDLEVATVRYRGLGRRRDRSAQLVNDASAPWRSGGAAIHDS
jgi:hypothetical protein